MDHCHAFETGRPCRCRGSSLCCGSKVLDVHGYHALCCSTSESTIGHNRRRDCIGQVCAYSDPATELEVPGLCPRDPALRPADVLTRALHPTSTVAADVGVRAPHAGDAGHQYLTEMHVRKVEKYAPHFSDLQTQGVVDEPIIFSAYGRRHPRATQLIHTAALRAARRRGWSSAAGLKKWWLRQLAAESWRRAARMVHACLPRWEGRLQEKDAEDDDKWDGLASPGTGDWLVHSGQ